MLRDCRRAHSPQPNPCTVKSVLQVAIHPQLVSQGQRTHILFTISCHAYVTHCFDRVSSASGALRSPASVGGGLQLDDSDRRLAHKQLLSFIYKSCVTLMSRVDPMEFLAFSGALPRPGSMQHACSKECCSWTTRTEGLRTNDGCHLFTITGHADVTRWFDTTCRPSLCALSSVGAAARPGDQTPGRAIELDIQQR
jgi:hypothetical protein